MKGCPCANHIIFPYAAMQRINIGKGKMSCTKKENLGITSLHACKLMDYMKKIYGSDTHLSKLILINTHTLHTLKNSHTPSTELFG